MERKHKPLRLIGAFVLGATLLAACDRDDSDQIRKVDDSFTSLSTVAAAAEFPQTDLTPIPALPSLPIPSATPLPEATVVTQPTISGNPSMLVPNSEDLTESVPFNWTRDEILFGPNAGFEKARNGQSLSVWVDPSLNNLDVGEIIRPWNQIAQWSLFVPADSERNADIVFVPRNVTFVKPEPDYKAGYTKCVIYSESTLENKVAKHEIGHCLGFVDFIYGGIDTQNYINPQRCDTSKLYFGVMSYCNWLDEKLWFGEHDRKLLELAGYLR